MNNKRYNVMMRLLLIFLVMGSINYVRNEFFFVDALSGASKIKHSKDKKGKKNKYGKLKMETDTIENSDCEWQGHMKIESLVKDDRAEVVMITLALPDGALLPFELSPLDSVAIEISNYGCLQLPKTFFAVSGIGEDRKSLQITVRKQEHSSIFDNVANFLYGASKVGESIYISKPEKSLIFQNNIDHLIIFCGGISIAPFIALIDYWLPYLNYKGDLFLFVSDHSYERTPFYEKLMDLEREGKIHLFMSATRKDLHSDNEIINNPMRSIGHFSEEQTKKKIVSLLPLSGESLFFYAGPALLKEEAKKIVREIFSNPTEQELK